jgi:signal transduction histidine kinase
MQKHPNSSEPEIPTGAFTDLVDAERVRLLFWRNLPPMLLACLFALALGWFLQTNGAVGIPVWLFLKFAVVGLRGLCHLGFSRNQTARHPNDWLRLYLWLLAADGLVWGAPVFLINTADLVLLSTVMSAVVGVASVGCVVLSVSFAATTVFCLCTVVPFMLLQLSLGGQYNLYMASSLGIFLVVVLADARRAAASTSELLQLRFQSTELLTQAKLAKADAAASNEAKTRFMAAISHEIRTPMHVVLGMLELLLKQETDSAKKSQLMMTQKSGAHLLGLINDVLDFSRIEAGGLELNFTTFDLRMAVEAVAAPFYSIAEAKGLRLTLFHPFGSDFTVFADEMRVRQVLYNLLGNAAQHTSEGRITLTSQLTPDAIAIRVKDSGTGIPEAHQASIFDPFRQGPAVKKNSSGGSGLGLAIARQLAEAMRGELVLESSSATGSCFKFSVPRHAGV